MFKNITKNYRGFTIDIRVNSETVYAYWTDGDIENNRRFSGYSINEILDIVKHEIDTMELSA